MSEALDLFVEFYAAYGYWVLFFGVMLENAGVPLPGETALLAAGYLCHAGMGARLHLETVMLVAFCGAVIGDNIGYWLGREVARPRLERGQGFLFLTPKRLKHAEGYFHKYGTMTVFVARFIAVLRIIAGPAAGVSGMPWPRFFLANMSGAALWSVVITLLGYYFGYAWETLHHWLGRGAWAAVGAVVVGVLLWHIVRWFRHRGRKTAAPWP